MLFKVRYILWIVALPADKGRVTVVMDKTDYYDKMDALVNDKQAYEVLKRDPTPALQRKFNSKLLDLKKTDANDIQRYSRLRRRVPQPPKLYGLPKLHKPSIPMRPIISICGSPTYQLSKYLTAVLKPLTYSRLRRRVPQPPKLYGLPKLHKPSIPMRPIISICGSPTYQLSKYLTAVLKPLTDESRPKLQSTMNFIDATMTVQIPDDYKLVSFDVKSQCSLVFHFNWL